MRYHDREKRKKSLRVAMVFCLMAVILGLVVFLSRDIPAPVNKVIKPVELNGR